MRRGDSGAGSSIIAGYPWFADWGRDTMIALPGLATGLARYGVAADILRTFAKFVDRGMLPNTFPDRGGPPEYNTADATLWLFHALHDYLGANRDPELTRELFPTLIAIIDAHVEGTRYGIGVDPSDGLLRAGEAGIQLTWMDAKQGGHVFTPRIGKPVEINALWMNALDVAARLAGQVRSAAEKRRCESLLARAAASFERFWNPERSCLYDVIDVDGGSADGCERAAQSDLRRVASLQRLAARADARRGGVLRARAPDQLRTAQLEPAGCGLHRTLRGRSVAARCRLPPGHRLGVAARPLRPGPLSRIRRCPPGAVIPRAHRRAPGERVRRVGQRDLRW